MSNLNTETKTEISEFVEKSKVFENSDTMFSTIVKNVAKQKEEKLIKIVEKYDQEHITRKELIKLIINELAADN